MRTFLRAALISTVPVLSMLAAGCNIEDLYRTKDRDNRLVTLETTLSGQNEVPPADPNGRGTALLSLSTYDETTCFDLRLEKLAPVTAAHVHQAPAAANGPVVVDLMVRATVPDWCKSKDRISVLRASDGQPDDAFGRALAFDADTAIVSAREAAYAFVRRGELWLEQQKLTAQNPGFGAAVALSGDTAAVSAAEVVYIFVRSYDGWSVQQLLTMPDSGSFGTALALSGDTLLVGAPNFANEGVVFVFDRVGTFWTATARLQAEVPSLGASACFGCALALSGDFALVGAPFDSSPGQAAGTATIFERNGTNFTRVPLAMGDPDGRLGAAVALSGTTALVGAPGNLVFDGSKAVGQGTAEVFERLDGTWTQQRMAVTQQNQDRRPLDALTADDAAFDTDFASAVAVADNLAVVGAPRIDAAYTFSRAGELWSQGDKLTPVKGQVVSGFGTAVAASSKTVLVGAPGDDATQGAVFAEDLNMPVCEIPKQNFNGCVGVGRDLLNAIADGPEGFYVNVHTTKFSDGAVRGQLENPDTVNVARSGATSP